MLGHGATGQFAIGQVSTGATAESITVDKWFVALSEPVRIKQALSATQQHVLEFQPLPIINIGWFSPLSEPVRIKPRLHESLQRFMFEGFQQPVLMNWFMAWSEPVRLKVGLHARHQEFLTAQNIFPVVPFGWFEALTEPVRTKPRLLEDIQQFAILDLLPTILMDWFAWLSEPVRIKPGLRTQLQEVLARATFIPTNYTARLDATEQGDFLTAVLYQFNPAIKAYVDIIENDPRHRGNLGIIAAVAQSSIVASIAEPQTVPSTGTPVSTVAGARVAIIIS